MQAAHSWTNAPLEACMARHGDAGPHFMDSSQLLAFYRDVDCARVFMPAALAARAPADTIPRLCVDAYHDWDTVCPQQERSA